MNKKVNSAIRIILCWTCSLIFISCSNRLSNDSTSNNSHVDTVSAVIASPSKNVPVSNTELKDIYTRAIKDYIQLANAAYKIQFDTLFFGKHVHGQPDDFPDISLPDSIGNVHLKLVSIAQVRENRDSSVFINMFGDVHSQRAEFIFVTFLNGFSHSFDCFTKYEYSTDKNEFTLVNSRFKPFNNRDIKTAANKTDKH